MTALPTDAKSRKDIPIVKGCLDYFPNALAAVAEVSKRGNDQHNPGQEMHHARGKSGDHADCIVRHLMDRGTVDTDGIRHAAKVAWRALALLQEELEAAGAPLARGARVAPMFDPLPRALTAGGRLPPPVDTGELQTLRTGEYELLEDTVVEHGRTCNPNHPAVTCTVGHCNGH